MSASSGVPPGSRPVLLYGSGAIGGLIAAALDRAGVAVGLVARGESLEAIGRRGLAVETGAGRSIHRLRVYGSAREACDVLGRPLAVVLAVKAYDVDPAASDLREAFVPRDGAETPERDRARVPVLCLQNGLGSESRVAALLPGHPVLAGAITLSVERTGPAEIRVLTEKGGLTIAPYDALSGVAGSVAEILERGGFRVKLHPHADSVKWSKALLNLWANASCAVFDRPPSELVRSRPLFHLDWLAFREALRVMSFARIPAVDLPGYPVRLLVSMGRWLPEELFRLALGPRVAGGRGGKMPSFWLDLESGRGRTEVGSLNGAISRAADDLGLGAPANQALCRALEAMASGRLPRDYFRGRPETLQTLSYIPG